MSLRKLILPVLVAVFAAMGFVCAPALAFRGYVVTGQIVGSEGSGPGEFNGSEIGLAVDDSANSLAPAGFKGDLYAAENGRVQLFNAKGEYVSQFTGAEAPSGPINEPSAIAVDNSANVMDPEPGDVYVANSLKGLGEMDVVDRFTAEGKYVSDLTGPEECAPEADGVEKCGGTGAKLSFHSYIPGITVDGEGDLWVYEDRGPHNDHVSEFSATGQFIESFKTGYAESTASGIAVDSKGHVFVAVGNTGEASSHVVAEFDSADGERVAELAVGSPGPPAVDSATNNVFIEPSSGEELNHNGEEVTHIEEFGPFGEPSSSPIAVLPPEGLPRSSEAIAVAVNESIPGTATVYTVEEVGKSRYIVAMTFVERPEAVTGVASEQTAESAVVSGTVNPLGIAVDSCEFEYASAEEYALAKAYTHSKPCEKPEAAQVGAGTEAVAVHAKLEGLAPNGLYHYRLKAANAKYGAEYGHDATFGVPQILRQSATEVAADSARLTAEVDPEGAPTEYTFEYGTSEAYGSHTEPRSAGAGRSLEGLSEQVSGLRPQTTYHFRLVASNVSGVSRGPDVSFTTPATSPPGSSVLPDDRAYELVSPADDPDSEVYVPALYSIGDELTTASSIEAPFVAAADGDAVAYAAGPPPSAGGDGAYGSAGEPGNEYLARRGPNGWEEPRDIQPPGVNEAAYQAFSSDLSVGFIDAAGPAPLSPLAPGDKYQVLYSRALDGEAYDPLFTVKPPNRTNTEFETYGVASEDSEPAVAFAGASENLEDVLFEANDALIAGSGSLESELAKDVASEIKAGSDGNYLYDSVDGRLLLVDVLPGSGGKIAPGATFGAIGHPGDAEDPPDFSHVISNDGSRIFWSDGAGEVFVRENAANSEAKTVSVSAGPGRYWTATPNGAYAFYTEEEELWRFDSETNKREVLEGVGAGVQGVIGAGESGEQVYFVATGGLAPGAIKGAPNLYLLSGKQTVLIATLEPEDNNNKWFNAASTIYPLFGDWQPDPGHRTAEVTADGQSVVFMSKAKLKTVNFPEGYDNSGCEASDLGSGVATGCIEVYVYEARDGGLFCVSCDPSGAPPSVINVQSNEVTSLLPISWSNTYQTRWISGSGGRVFFDSYEPLASTDTNGTLDVYEWEAGGEGTCKQSGGCVFLLSGGDGSQGNASFLLDASESGEDVFIASRSKLLPQDHGENFVVYDARVNGVEPVTPSQCTGTGCQGVPPAPPIFATPSSETFAGVGNFPPPPQPGPAVKPKGKPSKCRRGFVKKHDRCVKKPKPKAGKSSNRRSESHA
jgi:hypothetical protein